MFSLINKASKSLLSCLIYYSDSEEEENFQDIISDEENINIKPDNDIMV